MQTTLRFQHDRICLEADTTGIGQIVSATSNLLQSYLTNVKGFIQGAITPIGGGSAMAFVPNTKLDRLLTKTNYVSLSAIHVYVPAGVSCDWVTFLDAVNESQQIVNELVKDTLKPAITYFSQLCATPETLLTIAPSAELAKIKLHEREMTAAKKEIAACYSKHGVETKRVYGDAFKRNGDWAVVNKRLTDLTTQMATTSPALVVDLVTQLAEILDRLVIRMQQSPDIYRVSGVTSGHMARISMQLGFEVEFYAAHCYLVQTAMAAMADTVKQLSTVLEH